MNEKLEFCRSLRKLAERTDGVMFFHAVALIAEQASLDGRTTLRSLKRMLARRTAQAMADAGESQDMKELARLLH